LLPGKSFCVSLELSREIKSVSCHGTSIYDVVYDIINDIIFLSRVMEVPSHLHLLLFPRHFPTFHLLFKYSGHADVSSACKNSGPLPCFWVKISRERQFNTAFAASMPEAVTPATP
jgi:hypothetical protein